MLNGQRGEELLEHNPGLPDSARPQGLCPRCNLQSGFEVTIVKPWVTSRPKIVPGMGTTYEELDRVAILHCRTCGQGVVVIEERWQGDKPYRDCTEYTGVTESHHGFHWWPLPETNLSSDIPQDIRDAFAEAILCLSANCSRAAAAMGRRTLEAICVDKGATTGTLHQRLTTLVSSGVLLSPLGDWAAEVKLIGNKGAHFDLIVKVEKEDAQKLLLFLRELMRYLYELPAELARRRI